MASKGYDSQYAKVIGELQACGNNCSCGEIRRLLESLGFRVNPATDAGGHKTFSHSTIKGFYGGNYNCGHGRNPNLTDLYVKKIIKTIKSLESELKG